MCGRLISLECWVEPKISLLHIADWFIANPNKWKLLIIIVWEYTFWPRSHLCLFFFSPQFLSYLNIGCVSEAPGTFLTAYIHCTQVLSPSLRIIRIFWKDKFELQWEFCGGGCSLWASWWLSQSLITWLLMNKVRSWEQIRLGSRKPSQSWRQMTVRPLVRNSGISSIWKCLGLVKPWANFGSSVFSGWDQKFIQRSRF